ncbi:MAG: hypothetical protein LBP38_06585 [Desulfovibrio sp.]|nr:hypothetical protein [Desulfovibrio sp.]
MDFSALLNLRDNPSPLYCRHPELSIEQPAFVQLDENGRVTARFDDTDGSSVPDAVRHDRSLRWDVTAYLSGKALAALAENPTFRALLKRVHDGRKIEPDGKNYVGVLSEDAEAASDAIEDFLNDLEPDIIVMDVDDWLFDGLSLFDHWSGRPLDTAVEELEKIALEERESDESGDGVIIEGDIEQALIREAEKVFLEGFHTLDKFHLEALVAAGRITAQQADGQGRRPKPDNI